MPTLSDIVTVTATIRPPGVVQPDFGRTLFLTFGANAAVGVLAGAGANRVRAYARLEDVGADFSATSEAYKAAAQYFGQANPKNFLVARWRQAAVQPRAVALSAITTGTAISGGFSLGTVQATVAITQTAPTDAQIASGITATGFTFTASSGVVTIERDSGYGDVPVPGAPSTGTDSRATLGLDTVTILGGGAAEVVGDALSGILLEDSSWYFLVCDTSPTNAIDLSDVAAWSNGQEVLYLAESTAAGVLVTGETTSELAAIYAAGSRRVATVWSATRDYKAPSVAGGMSSVNFTSPQSIRTADFMELPGCTPDVLTATQEAELQRKRVNFLSSVAGRAILTDGSIAADGRWIDSQYWLDWLIGEFRAEIFNLFISSGRVPQTGYGMSLLRETVDGVLRAGVRNGGISPGTAPSAMRQEIRTATNDPDFDGKLSTGYLTYVGRLSDQSASDRAAREAPPFRVWCLYSGAVHSAAIDLTMEG